MMFPFGLLATGALGTGRQPAARVLGSAFALLIGLGFVLAVKYAQLFFPPRTVSLNYIIAQSIGAVLGVGLFHPLRAVACGALPPPPTRRPACASCSTRRSSASSPSRCFPSMSC